MIRFRAEIGEEQIDLVHFNANVCALGDQSKAGRISLFGECLLLFVLRRKNEEKKM